MATIDDDNTDPVHLWPQPDLDLLRNNRRKPPKFPVEVLGVFWGEWVTAVAAGAAAPIDYTACTLLATSATLIGHARWCSPWQEWSEPPVLWIGNVGDPSSGKSPAADPVLGILRDIEIELAEDFPTTHRQWLKERTSAAAHRDMWESEVKNAAKKNAPPPDMPIAATDPPEPARIRVVSSDATVEKLAELAATQPKGLMLVRDELAGWYGSLGRYSKSGADRAFWVEAHGGRGFTVDRKNAPLPIVIARLGLGLFGGLQPDRLCEMMASADDGLIARFLWAWPDKVPARRPVVQFDKKRAANALRLLYDLPLVPNGKGGERPFYCAMTAEAAKLFESWWVRHQSEERVGPLASALGKAPGHVVRLSLVLEHLWWCADPGISLPPSAVSIKAVAAAVGLVVGYFIPMHQRVYGDAGLPEADRLAAVVARWIVSEGLAHASPPIINARELRRKRLPELREAEKVKLALGVLIEADWIIPAPTRAANGGRPRGDYAINPRLKRVS